MNKSEKISSYQVILLIIIYRLVIAFSFLPAANIPPGNQDTWIVVFLSIPYTILFCFPILFLSNRFNDYTLIEYMEIIFGKYLGKIIGLIYTLVLLSFSIANVSVLTEILSSTMFSSMPTIVTISIMLITCSYVSYKGLEPIARGAEIFVPFILAVIFIFPILGIKNLDFKVFLPILKDSSFRELNKGAIEIAMKFADILILAMIVPNLEKKEELNNIFMKSLFYSVFMSNFVLIISQAALGIEQTKHSNFPFFTFARLINVFNFIQRVESIYVVSWITANVGKISGYLYFSTVSLAQILNKKDNKKYIIPMTIVIAIVSIIYKNRSSVVGTKDPFQKILLIITLISVVITPSIALLVYFVRRKKLKEVNMK